MKLSVLDQSPVVEGRTAASALEETLDLVRQAELLGYHRYWFAEHHGSASFAGTAPAMMMAAASQCTKRIRLGAGGFLMGNHRPMTVAENIRVAMALAPGRIDAGLGRAPGGDGALMEALDSRPREAATRIRELLAMLRDQRTPSVRGDVIAMPDGGDVPQVWMLGTSTDGATLAGQLGLPYAFGAFIDPTSMDAALAAYYRSFVPSVWSQEPVTMVATVLFCASTMERARSIADCSERWFVDSFLRGRNVRFPSGLSVSQMNSQERFLTDLRRSTVIIGDGPSCAEQLATLSRRTATSEIAIVTITEHHSDRLASYELLAESMLR
jgi:luciferase family oxidoreductase group 1